MISSTDPLTNLQRALVIRFGFNIFLLRFIEGLSLSDQKHDNTRMIKLMPRKGDAAAQRFAMQLGATWAGDSDQPAPDLLDAAILFAPVGALVPVALRNVRKGGVVVCAGIRWMRGCG